MHKEFRKHRAKGEWFDFDEDAIQDVIDRMESLLIETKSLLLRTIANKRRVTNSVSPSSKAKPKKRTKIDIEPVRQYISAQRETGNEPSITDIQNQFGISRGKAFDLKKQINGTKIEA